VKQKLLRLRLETSSQTETFRGNYIDLPTVLRALAKPSLGHQSCHITAVLTGLYLDASRELDADQPQPNSISFSLFFFALSNSIVARAQAIEIRLR
jgi:hypothetical protein